METLRRRIGSMELLIVALSVGLLWSVQPAGAAGNPPNITFFGVWLEQQPTFTAGAQLIVQVTVDDPDGQVPNTIQPVNGVVVTRPDNSTVDLTSRFRFPNLGFEGNYRLSLGVPATSPLGTYTVTVTNNQGLTKTATETLSASPTLTPANITAPALLPPPLPPEAGIINTLTPLFKWDAVANAGTMRVIICNADLTSSPPNCGDGLYTSQRLPGAATQFALPPGVLDPGRRYAVGVEAFDTPGAVLPTANFRARSFRNFSVAGPNVGLSLNQSSFKTGDTLRLRANIRNDGAPVKVDVQLWAGVPTFPDPVELIDLEVTLPSTAPDVSLVANDIFVLTFASTFPPGTYVLGIRFSADKTEGIMAQSTVSFSFAP